MVALFLAFSASRSSVASPMAFCSSATSLVSSSVSADSSAIVDLPLSMAAESPSMSSCNFVRVTLFLPISVSQKPSCCASWFASSSKRSIIEPIMAFTFANGSAMMLSASIAMRLLCNRRPSASRNSRMRRWAPVARSEERRKTRDVAWRAAACGKARCFSALPDTSSEDRISIAFAMASISSARNCCFSWNDIFFSVHSVVISDKVFSLSAKTVSSDAFCFSSSAFCSAFRLFSLVISRTECSAFSMKSSWSLLAMLNACCPFISSFCVVASCERNSSCNRFSIEMTPPDWNSYAFASGAA
mmetsp:Transcript_126513/g.366234  ORF Transcript_126513/g.366234 Transcript_126513/m.366234 type:complete len:302 (-) Transcript_126513:460-1365(-)